MSLPLSRTVVGALACTLVLGSSLLACNKRKAAASPSISIRQLSSTTWRVLVPGYQTTAVGLGVSYCAVGFQRPATSPISSVNSVTLHQQSNSASMPRFAFATNSAVAASFNAVQSGAWTGFLSQVTGPNAGGKDNYLDIILTVGSGTTRAQLATALKASVIAIDGATIGGGLLNKDRDLMTPTTVTDAAPLWRNAKTFHNGTHTSVSSRRTSNAEDTLYFMLPAEFRFGQGKGNGWRAVLQDSNRATAERVSFAYVKTLANGKPDVSASGATTNVSYTLFGTGTGSGAILYTLTIADSAPLPRISGLRIVLPKPRAWPTDASTIHTQGGATTKIAAAMRKQWTFAKGPTATVDFQAKGSTLRFGALYDCATVRSFNRTKAYGTATAEDLEGPEAMYPSFSRGDQIGFEVQSQEFAGAFGLIFLSSGYVPTPLPSPFKDILVPNLTLSSVPFPIAANGTFKTPAVAVPAGVKFSFQAIFFKFQGANLVGAAFSDAMKVAAQN